MKKALRGEPDENSRSDLQIETVRGLCCDGAVVPVTEDDEGNPLNVGRKHRMVQPALKRALMARDKCCRYPGCAHERWLDAQILPGFFGCHVMHWADGGETSLDNTILLCSKYHRLLHEGAFAIGGKPGGEWQFRRCQEVVPRDRINRAAQAGDTWILKTHVEAQKRLARAPAKSVASPTDSYTPMAYNPATWSLLRLLLLPGSSKN